MSIPTRPSGSPAQPIKQVMGIPKLGGLAIPVYGYALQPTDGRGVLGSPAIPVIVLTAADLVQNGGTYELVGMPEAMPVIIAPANQATLGQLPIAIYPINSFLVTGPTFVSAEVGNVNSTTVVVTFSENIQAAGNDYSSGVTIKVNGSSVTISSGTRQANHAIVYYVITPAVAFGDAVTWEYSAAGGVITGVAAMGNVSAQTVTNNVAWYLSGGMSAENAIAVYDPISASSVANSYINIANAGTHNAAPGVAPTWAAQTGWTFNGSTQYLDSNFVPGNDWTFIAIVSNVADGDNVFGVIKTAGGAYYVFIDTLTTAARFGMGGSIESLSVGLLDAALGLTKDGGYVNGRLVTPAFSAATVANDLNLILGARSVDGAVGSYGNMNLLRFAAYDTKLTAAQITAVLKAACGMNSGSRMGGWVWFPDPRAVHFAGGQDKTYFGTIDTAGNVMAYAYDHTSDTYDAAFTLHATLERDDHDDPAFLVRAADSKIIAFYSKHNGAEMYYRISSNAEDISAWGAEQTITSDTVYTYANPIQLTGEANSPIYLFYRGHHPGGLTTNGASECFVKSIDGGATWSVVTEVFWIGGDTSACYAKVAQNGNARIDFAISNGNPGDYNTSVYHFYYQGGNYYKSDGTQIVSLPVTAATATLVYDGTTNSGWIWDIAIDGTGKPVIVYQKIIASNVDNRYRYARWNGSSWDDHEICTAGGRLGDSLDINYAGGVSLDHADVNTVYASRVVSGQFEIYKYVTADGGATWAETAITQNSVFPNFRPVVPRNAASPLNVLYLRGVFANYIDYFINVVAG